MKILCIGRNYVDHIKELGNVTPAEPVIFLKPDSALMRQRDAFYLPDWSENIQYEAELVFRINRLGKNIEERFAPKYIDAVTVGIDFTARDVQSKLKAAGLPWEKAKAFDQSAVVGSWVELKGLDINNLNFSLKRNGTIVQDGNSQLMIHSTSALIAHCSGYFTLKIGDLLFTGTPAGVGKLERGDVLEGFLGETKLLHVRVK